VLGHDRVGGLVGFNNSGLINNCYASGSISGVTRVGGLAGCNYQGNITNCYATGSVCGKENVGGLAGQNGHYVNNWSFYGTITNCYSTGTVSGQSNTGGFVGLNSKGSVIDCFWDIETSGQGSSNGGTAKTTTEMQMSITFLDWVDCCYGTSRNVWRIDEGNDYPRLWWEKTPSSVIESLQPCLIHASNPSPPDGIIYEDTWVSLSWSPGDCASSHRLFLGDDFDDVNNGTGGTFRGNRTSTHYVVGLPGSAYSGGLVRGTTYYWRIDEINDMHPESPWKGDVWSFTIPHIIAYEPSPPDGAIHEDTWVSLGWSPGDYAVSHDVYFGDDFEEVNQGTEETFQNNQLSTSFVAGLPGSAYPDGLVPGITYYWRIDEVNDMHSESPRKGNIWSFWIPPYTAYNPNPHDGATFVDHNISLSWTAGLGATLHSIYFGDNFDNVENATENVPQENTTYYPGPLELAKTYYWRVDEFNTERGTETHKGDIWSFTTADFIIVDDFESYNDLDSSDPNSNRIFEMWIDGFDNPSINGAIVGDYWWWEQTIVHSGNQSMSFEYNNAVGKSEATMTLISNRDWTENGVDTLSIWYRGNPSNVAEIMYIVLNGFAGFDNDNPNAAQVTTWTEWRTDLQEFAGQGVNLANVNSITLGFGNRDNPVAGGSGRMWFDDIRLYRSVPQELESKP
jgi:acyl carrier protein phosphodiesterase